MPPAKFWLEKLKNEAEGPDCSFFFTFLVGLLQMAPEFFRIPQGGQIESCIIYNIKLNCMSMIFRNNISLNDTLKMSLKRSDIYYDKDKNLPLSFKKRWEILQEFL
jgi:hypothetical protein